MTDYISYHISGWHKLKEIEGFRCQRSSGGLCSLHPPGKKLPDRSEGRSEGSGTTAPSPGQGRKRRFNRVTQDIYGVTDILHTS